MFHRKLLIPIACLSFACGGEAVESNADGGGGSGVDSGSGGEAGPTLDSGGGGSSPIDGSPDVSIDTTIPDECAIATTVPGPYPVTFLFSNLAGSPLFLRRFCSLDYKVAACATNYSEQIWLSEDCSVDCASPPGTGCVVCDECMEDSVAVAPNGSVEDSWNGLMYTFGSSADGCACHTTEVAPAARYRVTIPVFESHEAVMGRTATYFVDVDFELPPAGGVVQVPLNRP